MSGLSLAPNIIGAIQAIQSMGGVCIICNSSSENISGLQNPKWCGIIDKNRILQLNIPLYTLIDRLRDDSEIISKVESIIGDSTLIGLIGVPRVSVFGLNIAEICRNIEEKFHRVSIAAGCDETKFYDDGIQEIYLATLFRMTEPQQVKKRWALGVLGVTPFDFEIPAVDELRRRYTRKGWQKIYCFGRDHGLEIFRDASSIEEVLVVAPSGFPAAKFLQKTFGIPFHIDYPLFMSEMQIHISDKPNGYEKILIVHQQFKANSFRHWLQTQYPVSRIVVASFFMMQNYLCQPYDRRLKSVEDFTKLVSKNNFGCILADPNLKQYLPKRWCGDFFDMPHFAISN